ncbi:glycine cleavage system aminomethyltransferase GcvT [Woodsholea maritima]|uniref:glycine cleavage system aminomethyltransferase GcvT n=1 Tax=Woodsholea maritima TaxID=240237 RepID=UPI000399BF08|nr:glycine cleavage system aminomethyltransferase GcvT [Woodsholea maritima]
MTETLHLTPLHALHLELGAKMTPFAGYDMPLQYEGIMAEHLHTRAHAGLFDVSHMGQARITGDVSALEDLTTIDLSTLKVGEQRYTLLLNKDGGIMDDLMVSRPDEDGIFIVVNAATKTQDFAYMRAHFGDRATLTEYPERALLAIQGPDAVKAVEALNADGAKMIFMQTGHFNLDGIDVIMSRSGYTGEDGYEISVKAEEAADLARKVLADTRVKPIGLGARDSLRLEAGLCLYGHDMDESRSPIEASLIWAVAKSRRERADFPGAQRILKEIAEKPAQKRVGFVMRDRAPAREGAEIVINGDVVGVVTSGGFGPSADKPVGMGYIATEHAAIGTEIEILIRGKARGAEIVKMPIVEHRFYRG